MNKIYFTIDGRGNSFVNAIIVLICQGHSRTTLQNDMRLNNNHGLIIGL